MRCAPQRAAQHLKEVHFHQCRLEKKYEGAPDGCPLAVLCHIKHNTLRKFGFIDNNRVAFVQFSLDDEG